MAKLKRDLTPESLSAESAVAVQIIQRHFEKGLGEISDSKFLGRRYNEFSCKKDPIYAELLRGMDDEPLTKTFVSYWTVAQTLATQSRFWLEAAIADIIVHRARHSGRPATEVYTHAMLGQGFPAERRTVAEIGDQELEHIAGGASWQATIQQCVLNVIDVLVGEQERAPWPQREPFRLRELSQEGNLRAKQRDQLHFAQIEDSLQGPPSQLTTLQCNLLVIEPDQDDGRIHAWAIRFVNPKTIAQHPVRKQERVNLLRVYALHIQEKIMRRPQSISVCVAALVPRYSGWTGHDQYPDYFSSNTYWSSDRLWEFIGVPFEVVQIAIRAAAKGFRDKLKDGLRHLLPGAGDPEQRMLF